MRIQPFLLRIQLLAQPHKILPFWVEITQRSGCHAVQLSPMWPSLIFLKNRLDQIENSSAILFIKLMNRNRNRITLIKRTQPDLIGFDITEFDWKEHRHSMFA